MAHRFRFQVTYEGTEFAGWQVQPGLRTVQGELGRMLTRLGEAVLPTGAGRTDAGVHALAHPAHVDLEREWDEVELQRALVSLSPPDLAVSDVRRAGDGFHSRYDAVSRTYQYALGLTHNAFYRYRRWAPRRLPDPGWVAEELASFRGEQECASLAKSGTDVKTTVCQISNAEWFVLSAGAVFSITANRFLYGMVRALTGLLVHGYEEGRTAGHLQQVLEQRDRGAAGEAAPASGLYLVAVTYPGEPATPPGIEPVAKLGGLGLSPGGGEARS